MSSATRTRKSNFAADWERTWRSLADDAKPTTAGGHLLQAMLAAAAPVYGCGATLHRLAHGTVLAAPLRVGAPVICIGNLTLGGTGKTPLVMDLARRLERNGARPAVVTRGYASAAEAMTSIDAIVVSDGERLNFPAEIAGDEAVELASVLPGVPVVSGARRAAAAAFAVRRFSPGVILLDDGFQHHALARDCNVVVIDATRPIQGLRQFPRGSLREGVSALRRADVVVLARCEQSDSTNRTELAWQIHRSNPAAMVVEAWQSPRGLATLDGSISLGGGALDGATCVAFCGIGNPLAFRRTLEGMGLRVFSMHTVPDHSGVDATFLENARREAENAGARYVVCTRKDAVKLAPELLEDPNFPVLLPVSALEYRSSGKEITGDALADTLLKLATTQHS